MIIGVLGFQTGTCYLRNVSHLVLPQIQFKYYDINEMGEVGYAN